MRFSLAVFATVLLVACSEIDGGDGGGEAPAPEPITTESGLVITHLVEGTGASPGRRAVVRVHYHGTFPDGTVFDSSVDRGEPANFKLGQVIRCWTEALQLMKEGGKASLICHPKIAYGSSGAGKRIPPDSTLHFDVELIGVY